MIVKAAHDEHGLARFGAEKFDQKILEKAFSKLLGYEVRSSMDKKLLLGIFEPAKHVGTPQQQQPTSTISASQISGDVAAAAANRANTAQEE